MKKYYLLVLLFIELFACSNNDFEEAQNNQKSEESEIYTKSSVLYNYLGHGYDISEPYVGENSVKEYSIINIEKLVHDEATNTKVKYISNFVGLITNRIYGGDNYYSFREETSETTGVSGTVASNDFGAKATKGMFSASVEYTGKRTNKYSYSSKYSYAVADIYKKQRRLIIESTDFNIYKKYLDPYFLENINNLTTPNQADQIIKKFGTHVLLDITTGGYFRSYYKSELVEMSTALEKEETVKAGAKVSLTKVGLGADFNWNSTSLQEINKKNKDYACTITCYAGNTNGLSINIDANTNTSYNFNVGSWASSVDDASARVLDINWNNTYPIYEFVTDATKKKLLKDAVVKYLESKEIEMLELKPLFRMFNDGIKDTSYIFDWNEVLRSINGYRCIDGYILAKPSTNTKPMYKMFSNGNKDTFYLFDWNDVRNSKDRYDGIVGYVLTTPQENTKPMYRMFNNGIRDTHYMYDWGKVTSSRDNYERIDGYVFK